MVEGAGVRTCLPPPFAPPRSSLSVTLPLCEAIVILMSDTYLSSTKCMSRVVACPPLPALTALGDGFATSL